MREVTLFLHSQKIYRKESLLVKAIRALRMQARNSWSKMYSSKFSSADTE